ncbi:hypothetical protein THOM_1749, partial [Trachipleistophora hominis]
VMFNRYKLKELKRTREERNDKSKAIKLNTPCTRDESDKVVHMLKNSHLLLNAYNKILNNDRLLNDNIYRLAIPIFGNLISSKKDRVIVKSIECIKKICESPNFLAVKAISYDYFKSLFYLDRFPRKLLRCFLEHYSDLAEKYDEEFWKAFKEKMAISTYNKKVMVKRNLNESVYLLNGGFE